MGRGMAKHSTKNERQGNGQFVSIPRWEFSSAAFKALSGDEVKVYLALRFCYNGRNNGQICFSARQAGDVIHKSHSTGALALARLTELGFIKKAQDSTFGQKRLSREYELTAIDTKPAQKKNKLPVGTRDFMKVTETQIRAMDAKRAEPKKINHSKMDKNDSKMDKKRGAKTARLSVIK